MMISLQSVIQSHYLALLQISAGNLYPRRSNWTVSPTNSASVSAGLFDVVSASGGFSNWTATNTSNKKRVTIAGVGGGVGVGTPGSPVVVSYSGELPKNISVLDVPSRIIGTNTSPIFLGPAGYDNGSGDIFKGFATVVDIGATDLISYDGSLVMFSLTPLGPDLVASAGALMSPLGTLIAEVSMWMRVKALALLCGAQWETDVSLNASVTWFHTSVR